MYEKADNFEMNELKAFPRINYLLISS
jgi:hypothetical protein